ncbi:MAG: HAD hydrolase family protein [Methanocellales archaeon]|nr:HAD hydrolase family protein [Methanocellales archaeon]
MTHIICFDLEGPLSPQDNAYEVMSLVENGDKIFEVISKYDDMLALENREGYEAGDTLALIVPFLVLHDISEEDITRVSKKAKIVDGAKYLISKLKSEGWKAYIISTSYEQHAYNIGGGLGVPKENIACTRLSLSDLRDEIDDLSVIEKAEKDVLKLHEHLERPERIVHPLDKFFFEELPETGYGNVLEKVYVIGGAKKVAAVHRIAEANDASLSDIMVVGDSITDYKMLKDVKENGGVAVVFNGNEYAIPHASIGLASLDIRFLHLLTKHFDRRDLMFEMVKSWETKRSDFEKDPTSIPEDAITPELRRFLLESRIEMPYFGYLDDADEKKMSKIIEIHKRFRALVRGAAAKLG